MKEVIPPEAWQQGYMEGKAELAKETERSADYIEHLQQHITDLETQLAAKTQECERLEKENEALKGYMRSCDLAAALLELDEAMHNSGGGDG